MDISAYFGYQNKKTREPHNKNTNVQTKNEAPVKFEEKKMQNINQSESKNKPKQLQNQIKFPMKPKEKENINKPSQNRSKGKNNNQDNNPKKTTPTRGSDRIDEYIKDSLDKDNHPDFNNMTMEEVSKHFKNYQAQIGKNSGFDPKVPVDHDTIQSWVRFLNSFL